MGGLLFIKNTGSALIANNKKWFLHYNKQH